MSARATSRYLLFSSVPWAKREQPHVFVGVKIGLQPLDDHQCSKLTDIPKLLSDYNKLTWGQNENTRDEALSLGAPWPVLARQVRRQFQVRDVPPNIFQTKAGRTVGFPLNGCGAGVLQLRVQAADYFLRGIHEHSPSCRRPLEDFARFQGQVLCRLAHRQTLPQFYNAFVRCQHSDFRPVCTFATAIKP